MKIAVRERAELIKKRMKCLARRIWFLAWGIVTGPFRLMWLCLETVAELFLVVAKTTAQKALILTLTIMTIVLISMLTYAGFVHLYMPTAEISRPVHLSFRACSTGHGVCSFPSTNVSFFTDDGALKEELGPGQRYRVLLDFEMPDTPNNRNLGMFQVLIEMYDRNGKVTASSQRMAMPKYRSIVMRMVDLILLSPFYFFGFMEQTQNLQVELFSHYVDDYYQPSVGARVEVQSFSLQFYSVNLKLFANFRGLKHFLYYWPLSSAVLGILCNIFFFCTLLLAAMYKKSESLRKISEALRLQNSAANEHDASEQEESVRSEVKSGEEVADTTTRAGEESLEESSSSAKSAVSEMDDSETYDDVPSIQEPRDYPTLDEDDERDMEFVSDLRRRRIN